MNLNAPPAIAAVGVLAALALDDINAWLNGHDSLIGRLLERYPELRDEMETLRRTFMDVREHGDSALDLFIADVDVLLAKLGSLGDALRSIPLIGAIASGDVTVGGLIQSVNPVAAALESLNIGPADAVGDGVNAPAMAGEGFAGVLMTAADFARGERLIGGGFTERPVDAGPGAAPVINLSVTVEDTSGGDPGILGRMVGEATGQTLDRELRRTFRWLPGGG